MLEGILLVDKPEGWTSFDVVNYVRKIVAGIEGRKPRNVKVGHTGTLDPAATGLLILCVGKSTKRVPELIAHDKVYEVELRLGEVSTTADKEGEVTAVSDKVPTEIEITEVLKEFTGQIQQRPPAFSAIKVNGKRSYELARQGKAVELPLRTVSIYNIDDVSYDYPFLRFTTKVSSGTYIRSLAVDIGEKLGGGAYMSNLRRLQVGEYSLEKACAVSDLNEDFLKEILA